MRTFEERMEEISRRSGELLEKRKKRRRGILLTCIPLVLCLGLLGLWRFPQNAETESSPESMNPIPEICSTQPELAATDPPQATASAIWVETAVAAAQLTHTDHPGVSVQILSAKRTDEGTSLRVLWKNETDKEVIYGSSYFMDEHRDEQWIPCKINEAVTFTAIAYVLQPGAEVERTYHLGGVYEIPETGTCRFRTECFVYLDSGESQVCNLWAAFAVP